MCTAGRPHRRGRRQDLPGDEAPLREAPVGAVGNHRWNRNPRPQLEPQIASLERCKINLSGSLSEQSVVGINELALNMYNILYYILL